MTDKITADPKKLQWIAREARTVANANRARGKRGEPDVRQAFAAIARAFRDQAAAPGTPDAPRAAVLRTAVGSIGRLVALSLASASSRLAADEVRRQATEVAATAHVLRVRSRLSAQEQRLFDDLLRDRTIEQVIASLLRRTEDDALEVLRRQLGTEQVATPAVLARMIGAVRDALSNDEYDRIIMRLPHLSLDELTALRAHLRDMGPHEAADLLRSYLKPR